MGRIRSLDGEALSTEDPGEERAVTAPRLSTVLISCSRTPQKASRAAGMRECSRESFGGRVLVLRSTMNFSGGGPKV
jgi:hypothetical protein